MRKARAESAWAVNMPASQPGRACVSTDGFPAASTPLNTVSPAPTDAGAAEVVDELHDDPGAGQPDRVAKGDGAAVDVDDLVGDAEVGHGGEPDGGEGLVDLEQVDVGHLLADLAQRLLDGIGRLEHERRVGPGHHAVADQLSHRRAAQPLRGGLAHYA